MSAEPRLLNTEEGKVYGMTLVSDDGMWRTEVYMADLMRGYDPDSTAGYAWLLMGLSLVAGICFSAFFTFRSHREIQEILAMFGRDAKKEEEDLKSGYGIIKAYAGNLIDENKRIKSTVSKLERSHRYEILDKLIRNTYERPEEGAPKEGASEGEPDAKFFEGKCAVLCIRYRDASYRTFVYGDVTMKELVKGWFGENLLRDHEIFDTSSRETVCVFSVGESDLRAAAEEIISKMRVEIVYHYGIELEAGVGNVVDSIYQIHQSYRQAKAVLRYRESFDNNVYLYSDLVLVEDVYFYPKEYDEKISAYILAGQTDSAKELVMRIYRENFEENDGILTEGAAATVKRRLKDLLLLLSGKYEISIEDRMERLDGERSAAGYFAQVADIFELIAGNVVGRKKDAKQNTALKIMEYINENYCDRDLSLEKISQELKLHKDYISSLFSSQYGEPVSVVIEKRRIEKACRMIRGTDMQINDIAEEVGYFSSASFRRAFKKIMGVSPGEYRNC